VLLTLAWFLFEPATDKGGLYDLMVSLSIAVTVLGYGLASYGAKLALRSKGMRGSLLAICSQPLYWTLIGISAWRAIWEFAVQPFHWNKTRHGISNFTKSQKT
jgi:hypothetical protein